MYLAWNGTGFNLNHDRREKWMRQKMFSVGGHLQLMNI